MISAAGWGELMNTLYSKKDITSQGKGSILDGGMTV